MGYIWWHILAQAYYGGVKMFNHAAMGRHHAECMLEEIETIGTPLESKWLIGWDPATRRS